MTDAKKIISSLDEFRQLSDSERAELIDGEVFHKALPSGRHADVMMNISGELYQKFYRGNGGPGGWWIMPEVSIRYASFGTPGRILTADIAGWKRENTPEKPSEYPVESRPDWVCEVCISTYKKDSTVVPETLSREGVAFYWLVDVMHECINVYELKDLGYFKVQQIFADDGDIAIKPFDQVKFNSKILLGLA